MKIAEELKPFTQETMKIDMAPWVKTYTEVDMEKLYTELTLEKVENEPSGTKSVPIQGYEELFEQISQTRAHDSSDLSNRDDSKSPQTRRGKKKCVKILCKGEPGMGKTTMMKKIGWDWAAGLFVRFSIVLFVFLKVVCPSDAIENVIIKQRPELEGMGVTPEKLRSILEKFGNKCLLILDGLDEHALGKNQDVLKIVKGQKLLHCNIIVTSRPHSTGEVEQYFGTDVRVNGFTLNQAEKFALEILKNSDTVKKVLSITFSGMHFSTHCPIVLLIVCILAKEKEIDLRNKDFSYGELYFKLIRFLYSKYTVRKGIPFEQNTLIDVRKRIGKVAFEAFTGQNSFMKRSDILEKVGPDAFDYGLLIGHEDFRLIGQDTADILITFAHRTILEFLGSFYLVSIMNEANQRQMTTLLLCFPSLLRFCLWLVYSGQSLISFPNKENCLSLLRKSVSTRLDMVELNFEVCDMLFPAFRSFKAVGSDDLLILEFFGQIIKDADRIEHLILNGYQPTILILKLIGSKFQSLSSIVIENSFEENWSAFQMSDYKNHIYSDDDFNVVLSNNGCSEDNFRTILDYCKTYQIYPSVYLFPRGTVDVSAFLHHNVKKLFVASLRQSHLVCQGPIASECLQLTHIYFVNFFLVDKSVLIALRRATENHKLSNITHLCFENCRFGDLIGFVDKYQGHLQELFQHQWGNLEYFSLRGSYMHADEYEALSAVVNTDLLPKLDSLQLQDFRTAISAFSYDNRGKDLRSLFIDNFTQSHDQEFMEIFRQRKLQNLRELGLSLEDKRSSDICLSTIHRVVSNLESLKLSNFIFRPQQLNKIANFQLLKLDIRDSSGLEGNVSIVVGNNLPFLSTLILRNCELGSQDLSSLAKANSEDKLPELRHLDISQNPNCGGYLDLLFHNTHAWNTLLSINIQQSLLEKTSENITLFSKDIDVVSSTVEAGCLASLEELSFTVYSTNYFAETLSMQWSHLKKINILSSVNHLFPVGPTRIEIGGDNPKGDHAIFKSLIDMIDRQLFPTLETVVLVLPFRSYGVSLSMDQYYFSRANVRVKVLQKTLQKFFSKNDFNFKITNNLMDYTRYNLEFV